MTRNLGAFALAAMIAGAACAAPEAAAPAKIAIEILHTNDIHGYLRTSDSGKGCAGAMAAVAPRATATATERNHLRCLIARPPVHR